MRTRKRLLGFEDFKILMQYLYLDPLHVVVIRNAIGVPLRLRVNDYGTVLCKNLNFPDVDEVNWTDELTKEICNVVNELKKTPSVEYPETFLNRWEEIKSITELQMSLNRPNLF